MFAVFFLCQPEFLDVKLLRPPTDHASIVAIVGAPDRHLGRAAWAVAVDLLGGLGNQLQMKKKQAAFRITKELKTKMTR